jgi:hypothetical protein
LNAQQKTPTEADKANSPSSAYGACTAGSQTYGVGGANNQALSGNAAGNQTTGRQKQGAGGQRADSSRSNISANLFASVIERHEALSNKIKSKK